MAVGLAAAGLRGPLKAWREQQLQKIFTTGQTLRLQFPKEDLGFVYDAPGAAILPEQQAEFHKPDRAGLQPADHGFSAAHEQRRSIFSPEAVPGARLPHCSLRPPGGGGYQDQLHFVLLSSCNRSGGAGRGCLAEFACQQCKVWCSCICAAACKVSTELLCPPVLFMAWRLWPVNTPQPKKQTCRVEQGAF